MKFSGKMWPMITLKFTKKTGFHPLFRRYLFWKTTGGAEGGSNWPSSGFKIKVQLRIGIIFCFFYFVILAWKCCSWIFMMVALLAKLLILLYNSFNELIILNDQSVLYIKQIVAKFESNSQHKNFDHVILPPVLIPKMPLLFLCLPVLFYQLPIACPTHDGKLRFSSLTVAN